MRRPGALDGVEQQDEIRTLAASLENWLTSYRPLSARLVYVG
jgi:hypothetical protein